MKLSFLFKGGLVFVLFLFFILQSCSYPVLDKEAPAINEIKKGEKFTIILPENHSENFIWRLKEQSHSKIIKHINAVWHGNEKGVYYNFESLNQGTDTLFFTQMKMKEATGTAVYYIRVNN